LATKLFDEFERIDTIKGKQSARLSAVADRRSAISSVLEGCPVGRWIDIDEFFRFLRAQNADFSIARHEWKLYIAELQYGSFSYSGDHSWKLLQGRFIMAMLFEYAATLGLIDVAYVAPQLARNDFRDHWGSDDYSCLSRYDGLKYFRINGLGAWCLGQALHYQPEEIITRRIWRVLPNHDIVSSELNPDPIDVMFLHKVADRTSELVWRLDREKVLTAVEGGLTINAIVEFLEQHSAEPVPQTVEALLGDLGNRATRLRDKGTVRMIECSDAETARLILADPRLKTLCLAAGARNVVFRAADEPKVRSQLRKLGYIMPSSE
jgi:Helicase conserved C-terminal domain